MKKYKCILTERIKIIPQISRIFADGKKVIPQIAQIYADRINKISFQKISVLICAICGTKIIPQISRIFADRINKISFQKISVLICAICGIKVIPQISRIFADRINKISCQKISVLICAICGTKVIPQIAQIYADRINKISCQKISVLICVICGILRIISQKTSVLISVICGILLTFGIINANAQTPINLQAAIDTALNNNLSLKNEKLNADYLQKIKSTAWQIPQTNVSFEFGQINSAYSDNKFSVTQDIKFPSVYSRQKSVHNEEWKNGMLTVAIKENELKKSVSQVYYNLLYLQQKQKLLQHTDSIFATFLQNAELRFNNGESNILEKTTAETQRGQISMQLNELQNDYSILQLQFKLLLNVNTDFILAENEYKLPSPQITDTSVVAMHPYIKLLQQQQQVSFTKWKLEKTKLMPDVFGSYNNGTIRGYGADEQLYSSTDRFQSFEIGIGVPLFFGSQKASINATKISWLQTQNNYSYGLKSMQAEYHQAILEYNKNLKSVNYYEITANKNADSIIKTANLQYKNGDINYLEWVMLTNNAIAIQSGYIDSIKNLNTSIIQLNSITGK